MKLYLVQHGDSQPKEVDPERGLSDLGREDVRRVAALMTTSGVRVSRILHSGKRRAEETAWLLRDCLTPGGLLTERDGITPLDPVDEVAEEVDTWSEDIMLVGHLPFMAKLVSRLVAGNGESPLAAFQPGTVVCLERSEEGNWIIAWMIRPELVKG